MAFNLPELPWSADALEPHISEKTFSFHHGKHHAAYVSKLNDAVKGTAFADKTLEQIIKETAGDTTNMGIFNNAAQAWNHAFFWKCMKPAGGGAPTGELKDRIAQSFGSIDKLKEEFAGKAATLFGSGWTWLVEQGGKLATVQTVGAGNPMTEDMTPLLTLDVWEHAYYLDYQNRRPDFTKAFLDNLVNWDFVAESLP